MTRSTTAALTVFILFAGLAVLPQVALGQQENPTFQGELVSLDDESQTLTVENAEGMTMSFTYNATTQVEGGASSVQGLSDRAGAQIEVTYVSGDTPSDAPIAQRIVVLPE